MRVSGSGFGDDSIESDISKVEFSFSIKSHLENKKEIRTKVSFDLIIFSNEKDYLCYVEAVHML